MPHPLAILRALRFDYVRRALALVWESSRGWTVTWAVLLVIQGLLPAVTVWLTKLLVDGLAGAAGDGLSPENLRMALVPAAGMATVLLLQQILGSLSEYVNAGQGDLVRDHIKGLLHAKSISADYAVFESAEFYNRLEQANSQATTHSLALLQNIGTVVQSGITFVSIGALLLRFSPWLPLVLLVSTLPALYIVVRYNRIQHDWWQATTPDRRWADYFDLLVTNRGTAAEMRAYHIGPHFADRHQEVRTRLRKDRLGLMRRQIAAKLGAGALALAITGAAMVWMVYRVVGGTATLGDMAFFYQAFSQGQGLLRALLSSMGQIHTSALFLEHLFAFLDRQMVVTTPPDPLPMPVTLREGVEFRNVTFRYPGADRPALEDFSLALEAGKTTAIVGANGAGKSTLTKLLMRLYDPEAGAVLFDGVDLRRFDLDEVRRHVSIMFQFPINYQATAAGNIALGRRPGEVSAAEIEAAARGAGAHDVISRLPQGYDTMLGRLFGDSHDLSGGEWQRVALARAFLRRAPIVVLDEPTSFMDSWAENEWLQRFRRLVAGRTALIITHRFTTAMQADVIHVMEHGQVIETGDHASLLEAGGRYAQSWQAQTRVARGEAPAEEPEEAPSAEVPGR